MHYNVFYSFHNVYIACYVSPSHCGVVVVCRLLMSCGVCTQILIQYEAIIICLVSYIHACALVHGTGESRIISAFVGLSKVSGKLGCVGTY